MEVPKRNTLQVKLEECIYTSCYCEENIWKLCELIQNEHSTTLPDCYVVFISNEKEMIPLWSQKAANNKSESMVIWDYHVILIHFANSEALVYDFDSTVLFPCTFVEYAEQTFKPQISLKPEFCRLFRIINAESYLKLFSSNRSRMKKEDGTWLKEPPTYPCILRKDGVDNLKDFINMKESNIYGKVYDLNQLLQRFKI